MQNTLQIYNNNGELIVDSSKNYYNTDHITADDWSRIFGVEFIEAKVYDSQGEVRLSIGRVS